MTLSERAIKPFIVQRVFTFSAIVLLKAELEMSLHFLNFPTISTYLHVPASEMIIWHKCRLITHLNTKRSTVRDIGCPWIQSEKLLLQSAHVEGVTARRRVLRLNIQQSTYPMEIQPVL